MGNQGLGMTPMPTYIIPLKVNDYVLLGSTSQNRNWETKPTEEDRKSIYERCCQIIPKLKNLTQEDFITEKVGLRPEREGGPVINYTLLKNYQSSQYDIHLFRNNGFGGYGVQCSWGAANLLLNIFDNHMQMSKL
jgi:glycine/D-amino acid oxidase-like deaminating enzyme